MDFIPDELVFLIMYKLDIKSICKLAQSNTKFNLLSKDIEFFRSYAKLYNILKLFDYTLLIDEINKRNLPELVYNIIYERAFKGSQCLFSPERCALQAGRQDDEVLFEYFVNFYDFDRNRHWELNKLYLRGLVEKGLLSINMNKSKTIFVEGLFYTNIEDDRNQYEIAFGEGFRGTDFETIRNNKLYKYFSWGSTVKFY